MAANARARPNGVRLPGHPPEPLSQNTDMPRFKIEYLNKGTGEWVEYRSYETIAEAKEVLAMLRKDHVSARIWRNARKGVRGDDRGKKADARAGIERPHGTRVSPA